MKRWAAILGTAALMFLAGVARADDTTSLRGLLEEEVVMSASKSAQLAVDAPALSRSISAEEIRRYGVTSVDEALNFLGVGARAGTALGRPDVTVRGVGFAGDKGNHVLLLVDGHVINEPLLGEARYDQGLGTPLELIDHIEVILGPGSSVHGTSAVLAVVNVVTKSASSHAGTHAAAEGSLAGTQRATLSGGYSFDILGKRTGFTAGLSYFRQDTTVDLRPQRIGVDAYTGRPFQYATTGPPTGIWGGRLDSANYMDVPAAHLRLVRDRLEIMTRAVVSSSGDPRAGSDFDQPLTGTLERRVSASVLQRLAMGTVGEASVRVYGDLFGSRYRSLVSRSSGCPIERTPTCDYRDTSASDRVGAELQAAFDWLHDGRLTTTLGTNTSLEHVSARRETTSFGTGAAKKPYVEVLDVSSIVYVAGFAQQGFRPVRWLNLNAGGRVDWRSLQDAEGQQTFTPVFTPRVAIAVQPWDGATVKAIYAQAFRAPNPYEADAHTQTLVRADALRPERADSKELVLEQRVHAQRLTLSLFESKYTGIINQVVLSPSEAGRAIAEGHIPLTFDSNVSVSQYRNAGVAETRGFTAAFDSALLEGRLRLGASFTGTVARNRDVERIPVAPQVFGNARASFNLGEALPTVALAASFAGNTVSDRSYEAGFRPVPIAPSALDVRLTLTGPVPLVRGLSYRVIVNHAAHDRLPYAVGPLLRPVAGVAPPELAPTMRWNVLAGIQYDF